VAAWWGMGSAGEKMELMGWRPHVSGGRGRWCDTKGVSLRGKRNRTKVPRVRRRREVAGLARPKSKESLNSCLIFKFD
jgi:hypothetical protein